MKRRGGVISPFFMLKKSLAVLGMLMPFYSNAQEKIYYQVQADVYSEPLSIHAFTDDWDAPDFKSGKNAFAHGLMQLGVKQGQWDFSWIWRYDYVLRFSPDTAKLYYQVKNDKLIDANTQYNLQLEAQHVDTVGSRFAYTWQLSPNWNLITGATALIGRHYADGQVNALAQTTDQQQLMERVKWLNGQIDYSYDQPALKEDKMGWNERANHGYGFAFDTSLQGTIANHWKVNINIQDALAYLYWQDAPYTQYQIAYDQDQRPRFDIQGQFNKYHQYTQKLPFKIYTDLNYQSDQNWRLGMSSISNQYNSLWQLNAYWDTGVEWGIHFEPQTHALGLSVQHQNFGLKYIADDLNTNQAKRMGAQVFAQYQW